MHKIKNLLGQNSLSIVKSVLASEGVPWFYLPFTANVGDPIEPYGGSFSHLIFKDTQGIVSPNYDVAMSILSAALDVQEQTFKELFRIRLGLITRTPHPVVYPPHVDDDVRSHRTGLFYLNNSDGDTIVYKERQKSNKYNELGRNSPEENTWFDFDGRHWHSATSPTQNEKRIAITYNYTIFED